MVFPSPGSISVCNRREPSNFYQGCRRIDIQLVQWTGGPGILLLLVQIFQWVHPYLAPPFSFWIPEESNFRGSLGFCSTNQFSSGLQFGFSFSWSASQFYLSISFHVSKPALLSCPLLFSIPVSLFLFHRYAHSCCVLNFTGKWWHMAFVFLHLIYFT